MIIPLWIFLAIYGVFFLVCSLFVFFNFYHIARFGLQSTKTAIVLAIYTISFAIIVLVQINFLLTIDWTETVTFNQFIFLSIPSF